jgi:hypothetical protein
MIKKEEKKNIGLADKIKRNDETMRWEEDNKQKRKKRHNLLGGGRFFRSIQK